MSTGFYPDYAPSARPPMGLDEIKGVAIPSTATIGIQNFPSGGTPALFNAGNVHFSGTNGAAGLTTLVAAVPGMNIVVFGFGIVTNGDYDSAVDVFAGSIYEDGNDSDIYTFSTSLQGPMFQDFDKPVVLAPGKALKLQAYVGSNAATPIDVITVRYGIYNVAGKTA